MSYKALYRVFRPKTFLEVVGQEHIVSVLKSQIIHEQISHAYLFTGSRGTGKTSIAKIFARAISCPNSHEGEACMECALCKDTLNDSSMDIVEIDAASNNGVDEIRELRENVKYAPVTGKYKVYIIDEVHMLSGGAFNALLKTLEEPPAHGVFILATTEPQKLPETIISRCQRFDFERIDKKAIAKRLEFICSSVKATADEDALEIIADYAKGGLRDAISLLDQCIVFGDGVVNAKGVLNLLGKSEDDTLFDIGALFIAGNKSGIVEIINGLVKCGQNPSVLTGDIIEHFHKLMIFKTAKNPDKIIETTKAKEYIEQAKDADINMLLRAIKILSGAMGDMRYAFSPLVVLEVAFMEACTPEAGEDTLSILARLEVLEKAVKTGVSIDVETSSRDKKPLETRNKKSAAPPIEEVPFDMHEPPMEDEGGFIMEEPPKSLVVKKPSPMVKSKEDKKIAIEDLQESAAKRDNKEFNDREYDEFLKRMNKSNKGIYISLKDSFFAGIDKGMFTIGYPSDDCNVFAKAVEAKKDVILKVLTEMGFKDMNLCAKIVKQDKTEDLKEIFGDDIKFID